MRERTLSSASMSRPGMVKTWGMRGKEQSRGSAGEDRRVKRKKDAEGGS